MAKMNGAQMMVKALEDEGVSTLFGIPGGTVIHLYDALYDSKLNHILMRHEQAAAHAADGYARAGGKPGVCIATSGPGATNLLTGIATANLDSVPLVAITGQVAQSVIGTDAFQEADMIGASLPFVKHSFQIHTPDTIQSIVHKAFYIASSGRPGPVLVDFPADVQKGFGDYKYSTQLDFMGYHPENDYNIARLDEAVSLIEHAERPVIFAGGGVVCSGASELLTEFALKYEIPVTTTLLGKGAFPESHPSGLSLGMAGMHGHPVANRALMAADVIIAIGSRFSDRTTGNRQRFAADAKIIHIDLDPAEIDKTVESDVWLIGDAGRVLGELMGAMRKKIADHGEWNKTLAEIRRKEPMPHTSIDGGIAPWQALEALCEITDHKAIITTEVGQNQMWAAQFCKVEAPRRFLSSGGLGTMGFGFPAAIGAAYACPGQTVCCVAGDGSLMMNIQELDTCARYDIPVKIVLLNNACLGNVRQWQYLFYNCRYSNTIYSRNPDFVALSESMGVPAFSVSSPDELRPSLEKLFSEPGPALLDVRIPQGAMVLPMVYPGNSIDNMVTDL
ncbi:biosynthetic-type acetolactate synthase large subunit [Cloacibacillus sp. An23]|uniref:biosynthetic-type acetolactate synthase large subunit n=1 Tax=Cloacibacillus sp. An23 TaxID=1965591 RepID=UPI000B36C835|nr:biosynthetic-type acetolactate synthase large subunit [Cloacibacillus sp. An23]OUO94309.1 acetolactate synthase, large subunit, biosynthetic type [Cloacibacillus sp. An23]